MTPDDERRLLARIRREPAAFGQIFDAHYPAIFAYVFRRTGDFDVSKDVTAETFFKAYQGVGRYRWRGVPVAAWLFRIATNEINLYFRKAHYDSAAMARLAADPELASRASAAMDADRDRLAEETTRHREFLVLRQEMLALPAPCQDVLTLRYFEGKSVKEIAEILDTKEGTVKSLLSRGRDQLRARCPRAPGACREVVAPEGERA